ncbi:hypothetical protein RRG08_011587 [Elysia crispata]|uniref:Uncharacterized protein n=1 Tax=Elysia crispata TaxID=231223 RepID=A0AAE1CK49_9GAST|nr:hypothetical protein RRG08_011587 [Elysia crispata]
MSLALSLYQGSTGRGGYPHRTAPHRPLSGLRRRRVRAETCLPCGTRDLYHGVTYYTRSQRSPSQSLSSPARSAVEQQQTTSPKTPGDPRSPVMPRLAPPGRIGQVLSL